MKKICVLGSLNTDFTLTVPRFNQPGETLSGRLSIYTGGKGGNQAVSVARLKKPVTMIGCLGNDANGQSYNETLIREGVDVSGISFTDEAASGSAFIEVVPSGENRIAIAPGANEYLTPEVVDRSKDLIAESDYLLVQLETPLPAILEGMKIAKANGCKVILDPAPAQPLDDEMLSLCDYITPNETELSILTGLSVETPEEAITAAKVLLKKGAKAVINKRGAAGALYVTEETVQMFEGFKVNAVDTTAAGDSFNGGFAVALSEGKDIAAAIRYANAVGALSTTKAGAQPAMPAPEAVETLLQ